MRGLPLRQRVHFSSRSGRAQSFFQAAMMGSRAWRSGLTRPFYVPHELREIRKMLSNGSVTEATFHLWQLVLLGSNAAAATLGYMCLICDELDGVDCTVAMRRCRDSANRGDSYAQYVVAWLEYKRGNHREFITRLRQSARQRFGPAIGDLGRAFIIPSGLSKRRADLAKRFFRLAITRGHLPSIAFFFRGCKEGIFGAVLRIVGYFAFPLAIALLFPAMRLYPFSQFVFAYSANNNRPLFIHADRA